MSNRMVMSMVLIIGIVIGSIVPFATSWWYDNYRAGTSSESMSVETASTKEALPTVTYHFRVEQGGLSVVEGTPGAGGSVIMTGLNIQAWPKEMLEIAPKVQFNSLDEVQSFIDTVSELVQLKLNIESSVT